MYDVSRNIKITIGHNAMSSAPRGIIFNITFFFYRLIWLLLFAVALGGLLYLVIEQILLFTTYPKSVNIEIASPEKMLFPAVTVCNQNTLR